MKNNNKNYDEIAFDSIMDKLYKEYDNIVCTNIMDELFVYRPISRHEYKAIMIADIEDYEKQDLICNTCVLYPENYDWEDCIGGIPAELCNEILDKSCVSLEDMGILIEMYREEMLELENQMVCIIAKAFPAYKISEIEKLDTINFTKLFTRAEWTLANLDGLEVNNDVVEIINNALGKTPEVSNESKEETGNNIEENNTEQPKSNRPAMSPEQFKQYQEFCKKFPEFDMRTDYAFTGDKGMSASTVNPAQRVGWGISDRYSSR